MGQFKQDRKAALAVAVYQQPQQTHALDGLLAEARQREAAVADKLQTHRLPPVKFSPVLQAIKTNDHPANILIKAQHHLFEPWKNFVAEFDRLEYKARQQQPDSRRLLDIRTAFQLSLDQFCATETEIKSLFGFLEESCTGCNNIVAEATGVLVQMENTLRGLATCTTADQFATHDPSLATAAGREEFIKALREEVVSAAHALQPIADAKRSVYQNQVADFHEIRRQTLHAVTAWQTQYSHIRYLVDVLALANIDFWQFTDKAKPEAGAALQDRWAKLQCLEPQRWPETSADLIAALAEQVIDYLSPSHHLPVSSRPAVSAPELAICAFAAFCKHTANGTIHQRSGRTVAVVYNQILVPQGMTFGLSEAEFTAGVEEAALKGLLRSFTLGQKTQPFLCYQITPQGLELAPEMETLFPPDFRERVWQQHQQLKKS